MRKVALYKEKMTCAHVAWGRQNNQLKRCPIQITLIFNDVHVFEPTTKIKNGCDIIESFQIAYTAKGNDSDQLNHDDC